MVITIPTLLTARNLQTGYRSGAKTTVVADSLPELRLQAGQLVCLLGPNGSGKSTLLRTLAGLQPALAGEMRIEGLERWSPANLARKISLVLTDKVRGNQLTVGSVVELGRYPYSDWLGTLSAADNERIDWALRATGIDTLRERKMHTLSDGQNQKVMLARALAQDTPILMLDEPTAHVDLPSRIRLIRLLHQLARETRKAILLSTHELDLALQIADEVWLLSASGQLHKGAPEDLVLNGIFESAFAEEDVVFDRDAGTFLIHTQQHKPVRLTGEGPAFSWTGRALRRAGFAPAAEAPIHIHLLARQGGPAWHLEQNGESRDFSTIQELLQAIK